MGIAEILGSINLISLHKMILSSKCLVKSSTPIKISKNPIKILSRMSPSDSTKDKD